MKYKVVVGWRCSFIFDEPDVAMNFAVNAIKHRDPEDGENDIKIEIITPETREEAADE